MAVWDKPALVCHILGKFLNHITNIGVGFILRKEGVSFPPI